ncbi:MAG TPA: protein-L-isoaspartate(D-aspartate) O-methyltransferase [Dehalococcoidia bacterium]|jgi:protein-L-isoaspartate(D-aspartate) O-methyltransferase|nr:protein-L-isoaspartate(D-aspartate) O-methyltransferase [Dehalococcoidia bacterium]
MDFEAARARLVEHLSTEIKDQRVLAAMARIPRERFVPPESQHFAYEDRPLPIDLDQTISQPFIIALMTQALELTGKEKVLELGTGSGYQAAILAQLARLVITVERLAPLAETAKKVLDSLGYANIAVHLAKDTLGWPDEAPYDAIMVTAGAPRVSADLLAQLAIDGRLVIPVGSRYVQELYKVTRCRRKNIVENLGGCCFVSLIGKDAWEEE